MGRYEVPSTYVGYRDFIASGKVFKPGSTQNCILNDGFYTFKSKNEKVFPTWKYRINKVNLENKSYKAEKVCFHDGPKEELHGCSARKNGEW